MELTVLSTDIYTVVAISENGECEVFNFLEEVEDSYKKSAIGIFALIDRISTNGLQNIPSSLSHRVDDKEKISELIKGKIRVFYFKGEGSTLVVCTTALIKDSKKVNSSHVEKAIKLKKKYWDAVKTNAITYNTKDDN